MEIPRETGVSFPPEMCGVSQLLRRVNMHIRTITAVRAPRPASEFSDCLTQISDMLTLIVTVLTAITTVEGLLNKQ
jgi:hypothetical protein